MHQSRLQRLPAALAPLAASGALTADDVAAIAASLPLTERFTARGESLDSTRWSVLDDDALAEWAAAAAPTPALVATAAELAALGDDVPGLRALLYAVACWDVAAAGRVAVRLEAVQGLAAYHVYRGLWPGAEHVARLVAAAALAPAQLVAFAADRAQRPPPGQLRLRATLTPAAGRAWPDVLLLTDGLAPAARAAVFGAVEATLGGRPPEAVPALQAACAAAAPHLGGGGLGLAWLHGATGHLAVAGEGVQVRAPGVTLASAGVAPFRAAAGDVITLSARATLAARVYGAPSSAPATPHGRPFVALLAARARHLDAGLAPLALRRAIERVLQRLRPGPPALEALADALAAPGAWAGQPLADAWLDDDAARAPGALADDRRALLAGALDALDQPLTGDELAGLLDDLVEAAGLIGHAGGGLALGVDAALDAHEARDARRRQARLDLLDALARAHLA